MKIQFPPNAILERNKTEAFAFTNFHGMDFLITKNTIIKNRHPIELLSKAVSLEDKSMYLTTKPMVLKIIIDNIN